MTLQINSVERICSDLRGEKLTVKSDLSLNLPTLKNEICSFNLLLVSIWF